MSSKVERIAAGEGDAMGTGAPGKVVQNGSEARGLDGGLGARLPQLGIGAAGASLRAATGPHDDALAGT